MAIWGVELVRKIADGGTAHIFEGIQELTRKKVAVKRFEKTERNKRLFDNEVNALSYLEQLNSQNIPVLHDAYEDRDYFYLYETYIQGHIFDEVFMRQAGFKACIEKICELCDVLKGMHNMLPYRVAHLDLKPDNILMDNDKIYLIDFGNSRIFKGMQDKHRKAENVEMASNMYSAPEVINGGEVDIYSDIYSVGVLLRQALNISLSKKSNDYDEKIYEMLELIMYRALEPEVVFRYSDISQLGRELNAVLSFIDGYSIKPGKLTSIYDVHKIERNKSEISLGYQKGMIMNHVYVCGTYGFSGVTSIALALTSYLEGEGIPVLLVEENDKRSFMNLYNAGNRDLEYTGLVCYHKCRILPNFGIHTKIYPYDIPDVKVMIHDLGAIDEKFNLDSILTESLIVVVMTDISEWRYDEKRMKLIEAALEKFKKSDENFNIVYVVNMSDKAGAKWMSAEFGIKAVIFPIIENVFRPNDKARKTLSYLRGQMKGAMR